MTGLGVGVVGSGVGAVCTGSGGGGGVGATGILASGGLGGDGKMHIVILPGLVCVLIVLLYLTDPPERQSLSAIGCGQGIYLGTSHRVHQGDAPVVQSQAYLGRFVFACSKKAGILAFRVSESSGALPSYIRRSLESVQNFLSKYLS